MNPTNPNTPNSDPTISKSKPNWIRNGIAAVAVTAAGIVGANALNSNSQSEPKDKIEVISDAPGISPEATTPVPQPELSPSTDEAPAAESVPAPSEPTVKRQMEAPAVTNEQPSDTPEVTPSTTTTVPEERPDWCPPGATYENGDCIPPALPAPEESSETPDDSAPANTTPETQ
jgi:hypothetical protein